MPVSAIPSDGRSFCRVNDELHAADFARGEPLQRLHDTSEPVGKHLNSVGLEEASSALKLCNEDDRRTTSVPSASHPVSRL